MDHNRMGESYAGVHTQQGKSSHHHPFKHPQPGRYCRQRTAKSPGTEYKDHPPERGLILQAVENDIILAKRQEPGQRQTAKRQ